MDKGNSTKERILKTAFTLFAQKGYGPLTMKDLCDATGLSRGGLYRHFSSTKEIFIAILKKDIETNSNAVEEALKCRVPAMTVFENYLSLERKSVFSRDRGFYFAVHEFAFLEKDQRSFFDERVKYAEKILSEIFLYGQSRGEFRNFDVEVVSQHMLHFWDSLKSSSSILTMSEEMVGKQIDFLREMIIKQ